MGVLRLQTPLGKHRRRYIYIEPQLLLLMISCANARLHFVCIASAPVVGGAVATKDFKARNIANAVWALAKMMHNPGDKFLNTMGALAAEKVAEFNPQNHANTIWAFGTLGGSPPGVPRNCTKSASKNLILLFTYRNHV